MVVLIEEGVYPWAFVLDEANGQRSRHNGVLLSGQNLAAGTVLQLNAQDKLIAWDGLINTAGDAITAAEGILGYSVNATGGDKKVSYLAREAEVNLKTLTYPEESTAGGEEAAMIASLAAKQIIARN